AVEIYVVGLLGSQQAEECEDLFGFFVSSTSCNYKKLPAGGETSLHKGVGDIRNSLKEVCR
ncbi:unnamed protein product, partial [Musa hybrid cultivar]